MIQAETLELLEWPRLCQHLSTFAATKLGVLAAKHLPLPETRAESLALLDRTREVYQLELGTEGGLSFEGIEDIGDALERAKLGSPLSGKELLEIATTVAGVRRVRRAIEAKEEELVTLAALVVEVKTHPELEQEIHHCIDDRGQVADRASVKLAGIRSQMKTVRDRIYEVLQRILQRNSNAVQEQTITQRGDRFVIPVKAPQKDAIPGAIRDSSSTGATLYIEPNAIVGAGNQLHQLRGQEKREEEAILAALTEKVAAASEDLEHLLAIATALDLATAKARYSLWLEANPPRFLEEETGSASTPLPSTYLDSARHKSLRAGSDRRGEGETGGRGEEEQKPMTLRRLRHPLLVWQQKHEQGREVIPIDVQIPSKIRVVAITGPNTGGKTVALKTLALAALMAKVGLFVPAKEPVELPWFDRVLADIGDEQSLQQSLSTFSGHIRRISRIMAEIEENPQSLILLDEVGAGTDPAEGSALAIALLEALANRALLTIATTHYGELKALKYRDERFENASVEFDEASLQPTYRLLWGIPGRSNALAIARRLGLGAEIVEAARERVGGFSEEINQTIAGLEQQRKQQELRAKEAEQLLQRTEQFYKEVSQKAAELREREESLKQSQERAVNEAVTGARAEIAKVIRQLQQGPQTNRDAERAQAAVAEIAKERLPKREPKPEKPSYMPQVGERVRLPKLGQTAEVLAVEAAENEAVVRFGLMKMTLPLVDIESLDGQKVEPPKAKAPPPPSVPQKAGPTVRTSNNTIDIRGSRVNDAEVEIERAIAKAVAAGSGALWVLHGKGTGRLREGVQTFLQQHPQVERFELAPQNEGGAGVTVAYLL